MTRTTSTTACGPACSILPTIRAASLRRRDLLDEIEALHPGLERPRVIHELTRRVITRFIEDAIARKPAAHRRGRRRERSTTCRAAGRPLVGLSPAIAAADRDDQGVPVRPHVPPSRGARACGTKADAIVRRLFAAYHGRPRGDAARMGGEGAGATRPSARDRPPTTSPA